MQYPGKIFTVRWEERQYSDGKSIDQLLAVPKIKLCLFEYLMLVISELSTMFRNVLVACRKCVSRRYILYTSDKSRMIGIEESIINLERIAFIRNFERPLGMLKLQKININTLYYRYIMM